MSDDKLAKAREILAASKCTTRLIGTLMDTNYEMVKRQQTVLRGLQDEIAVLRATLLAVEYIPTIDGRLCPWCGGTSWSGRHKSDCMRQRALRWSEK